MAKDRDPTLQKAIERTVARYAAAPKSARHYVSSKLAFDPAIDAIFRLAQPFGTTLDAGCGRGQLGLCLVELGRVERLRGFDWDAGKVEIANQAAGEAATYEVGDLTTHPLDNVDTILCIDVLHYLPIAEQDALLGRAFAALRPGGRLIVRDVDASRIGSIWTRAAEHIGAFFGINRAGTLAFRTRDEIVSILRTLGAQTDGATATGGPLTNVLIVAEKKRA